MNPLIAARHLGQQIWLDNLSRTLLRDGHLARLIADDGLAGVTTNPAIFHKAIADGRYYEEDLARLRATELAPESRLEQLLVPDVQQACDLFLPTWEHSHGTAGYVSLEVSPALAHDAAATLEAGRRLRAAVDRPNLLIKVPATMEGLVAIENLIAEGSSVNVTLMFSIAHVDLVAAAYVRGLERLLAAGGKLDQVFSVASLFLSRVDTFIDKQLAARGNGARAKAGLSAVAMARLAYQRYLARFHSVGFFQLAEAGARPQQMLWASTGTKNAAYSDLLYVEPLIGDETVSTLPDATLDALRDHGRVETATLLDGLDEATLQFAALEKDGIDLQAVGEHLQNDGLQQFVTAHQALLELVA